MKVYNDQYYRTNKGAAIIRSEKSRKKRAEWFQALKSDFSCVRCGENHPAVLQFHHRDASQKDNAIANMLHTRSRKALLEEIDKCDVLCANCHFKLHWEKDS